MRAIHTLLAMISVAATWDLTPFAQGADIRLANRIRLHCEASVAGTIPVVLLHGYGMSSEVLKRTLALPIAPSAD